MRLINQSECFKIHQCDCKRCFFLESKYESVWLTFHQLLSLRHKINALDINRHFEESCGCCIDIIEFCNRKDLMVLDTCRLIDIKAFLKTTFEQLEQESAVAVPL